jgi:hypothetical protein
VPCTAGTVTTGTADSTQSVGLTCTCLAAGAPLVGRGGHKATSPWRSSPTTATVRQRQHKGASAHSARTHCQCSTQIVGDREARAAARPQLGVRFACSQPPHVGRCQTIGGRLVSSLAALLHNKRVPTSSAEGLFTSGAYVRAMCAERLETRTTQLAGISGCAASCVCSTEIQRGAAQGEAELHRCLVSHRVWCE